jgi:Concanavalin A-like lectin/glucanases superfamily
MNTASNSSSSFLSGTSIVPQIVVGLLISIVLYIVLISIEMVYKSFKQISGTRVDVLPLTVNSLDKPRNFDQNPSIKNATLLPLSDNERSGAEFSYSFFLWIDPSSFRQEEGLLHILHKGHPVPYPLLGPGIFLHSNTNTLRVYMNSSTTWNNYVDVENIPVKKWVHIVVMARDNSIEVYINGNVSKRLSITDGVLYQNFGNLYLFSQRPILLNKNLIPSLVGESLQIFGTYTGNFSNLVYFSYALSYTEIQSLVQGGASAKTEKKSEDSPPYLEDTWWVNKYSS